MIIVSSYYATYYHGYNSLPCNTIGQCFLSYATSIFNGYTETTLLHYGIGGNVYQNVTFAVIMLFAFFIFAAYFRVKRYIKPILVSMFISQYIFVVIYPLFILPRISQNRNFGGGLSLFALFSLIAILFIVINDLMKRDYSKTIFKTKKDCIIGIILPVIFLSAPLYMFLGFSNSITEYTPLALFLVFLPMFLFVAFFIAWARTSLKVINGMFPKQSNILNKQIVGSYFCTLHTNFFYNGNDFLLVHFTILINN